MADAPAPRFLDKRTPPHIATLILMAGTGALSLNVFLPSLPSMAAHFEVEYAVIQLSVSLYLAATAVLQVIIGPISDRFGRRPVMIATAGVFGAATVGAIFAPTFEVFLACRMVQAVIASGLALSRAVVRDLFPQDQAASMIGYVTMGMSLVPMLGPALGGALDQFFGWQATFWMLALCGFGLMALAWADLGETAAPSTGGFRAQVRQYPELLTSQRFWGYCLAAASASGAFFAYLGGAPFVGTDFYKLDPAALGFFFGAPAVGYLVGNGVSGRYSVRFGINRMVLYGALLVTTGMALLALLTFAGLATPWVFFGFMTFVGLGNGMLLPNAMSGQLSVRPKLAGSASGLGGAIMIGGGAMLSVLAGFVLSPGSGPMPLVLVMLATSAASVACALWVIRRAAVVGE